MPHDGEISYYDLLEVTPGASPQEIRDAFRLHVRLLHPDHQTDPLLRELAEKQMRKLNRVYGVLSDPASRHAYDLALEGFPPPPPIVKPTPHSAFRRMAAKAPWVGAILISTGVLVWLAYDATPGAQNRTFDTATVQATSSAAWQSGTSSSAGQAAVQGSAVTQISRLKASLKAAELQRDEALREIVRLRNAPEGQSAEGPSIATIRPVETAPAPPPVADTPPAPRLPAPPPVIANAAAPHVARPPNRRLTGFWFYAIPPEGQKNNNQALYLPEFIEATITEDNGTIHGRYRSRFVIVDRALPPDVNFTFTGMQSGTQCACQWTGGGGAKGEITLKLTGDNSMKIDWTASELGSLGLSSGTATLTRKIE